MAEVENDTTSMRPYCRAAKRLPAPKGVEFIGVDAMFKPDVRRETMACAAGNRTAPEILGGGVHVDDCDALFRPDHEDRLDSFLEVAQ